MRRTLALYSMFALFACAAATLDRVPPTALQTLRGGAEHVLHGDAPETAMSPEA